MHVRTNGGEFPRVTEGDVAHQSGVRRSIHQQPPVVEKRFGEGLFLREALLGIETRDVRVEDDGRSRFYRRPEEGDGPPSPR